MSVWIVCLNKEKEEKGLAYRESKVRDEVCTRSKCVKGVEERNRERMEVV